MISFTCPNAGCGGQPQADDSQAGQQVICPKCYEMVRVPGAAVARPVPKAAPQPAAKPVAAKRVPKAAGRVTTARPVASPLPAPEEERRWFYDLNGEPCGPMTESDLAALVADDRLFAYTLVWEETQRGWKPAGRALPDLFEDVTADDLRPPIGWWQRALGVGLVCVAMAAVMAAGLTYLLADQGTTAAAGTTKVTQPTDRR